MTDPLSSYRPDRLERHDRHEDPPLHLRTNPARRDPQEVPALPDTHVDVLARAIRAQTRARPVGSVESLDARADSGASARARLDALRAKATPTYHTPEGDVRVSAPFRMSNGYASHEPTVKRNTPELVKAGRAIGMSGDEVGLVQAGRGTPEQVQRLAQALVDAGRLPPAGAGGGPLDARVRQMMFDHGIGFDCAGYVQQATLAVRGVSAPGAGFDVPLRESLSRLGSQGYRKVALDQARSGDVLVFTPKNPNDVGHRAIVYDARIATKEDIEVLAEAMHKPVEALAGRRFTLMEIDSSYGCAGEARLGGVRREAWFNDEASGQWFRSVRGFDLHATTTPYREDDRLEGVYRAPGAP